ncbi:hypothetical protein NSA50_04975 [Clostridium sp. DSM 100503]|uniref:hypothetical protein n=1 Tax=Clostridium sp. DSM 100503 TaxID=2963282 RepID=UPI00214A016E|nr:hypothetical protein [Clostridium sp. DSM 100503]MCR1950418.1 hypothetical protein [Clostridium sp. DSM 100503]
MKILLSKYDIVILLNLIILTTIIEREYIDINIRIINIFRMGIELIFISSLIFLVIYNIHNLFSGDDLNLDKTTLYKYFIIENLSYIFFIGIIYFLFQQNTVYILGIKEVILLFVNFILIYKKGLYKALSK